MERKLTIRDEANALTACAFRNGYLEELHGGKHSELLEKPELSRITDPEMKRLMIESTAKLAELLEMKESNPDEYWRQMKYFSEKVCLSWDKGDPNPKHENVSFKVHAKKQKDASRTPLPLPTVDLSFDSFPDDLSKWTNPQARAFVCNPLCAGIGPYKAVMLDEDWVRSAVQAIAQEGAEQFLVNMLAVLRSELKPKQALR